jgi:hypothetical protein
MMWLRPLSSEGVAGAEALRCATALGHSLRCCPRYPNQIFNL